MSHGSLNAEKEEAMETSHGVRQRALSLFLIVSAIGFVAMTARASSAEQSSDRHVRTIRLSPDVPVASQLRPDDDLVMVERPGEAPLPVVIEGGLTPQRAITFAASFCDAVVMMDVEESSGKLVDNDTWIETFTAGRIADIGRQSPRRRLANGERIVLRQDGGELKIEAKTLRTAGLSMKPLEPGHRYLVFVRFTDKPDVMLPYSLFEVLENGTVGSMQIEDSPDDWRMPIYGLTLDGVMAAVREAARELYGPK
jgi:hypothetical protein